MKFSNICSHKVTTFFNLVDDLLCYALMKGRGRGGGGGGEGGLSKSRNISSVFLDETKTKISSFQRHPQNHLSNS